MSQKWQCCQTKIGVNASSKNTVKKTNELRHRINHEAMVPFSKILHGAMVPDSALRGIMSTRLVAKNIKGKMTGKCDFRQVDFVHKEFEDAAILHVKE